jgi:hypothetical protein
MSLCLLGQQGERVCFVKANNSFYARLVYKAPDKSDSTKIAVSEEELKVEEE